MASLKSEFLRIIKILSVLRILETIWSPVQRCEKYIEVFRKFNFKNSRLRFSLVKILLWIYGLNLKPFPSTVVNSIFILFSEDGLKKEDHEILFNFFKNTSEKSLNSKHWLRLSKLFAFRGFYKISYCLRMKALSLSTKEARSTPIFSITKIRNTFPPYIKLKDFESFKSYFGSNEGVTGFTKFLKNQSVAIVGPSRRNYLPISEINSHDVVIRFNYFYSKSISGKTKNEIRADIVYYDNEGTNVIIEKYDGIFPKDVKCVCLKWNGDLDFFRIKNPGKEIRKVSSFQEFSFHGTLNLLPITLLDLIYFSPREVNIYNLDFMLVIGRAKGYRPNDDLNHKGIGERERFRRASVTHDPFTQYLIVRQLWLFKFIKGDPIFNAIMEMGAEEFALRLENTYSNPITL